MKTKLLSFFHVILLCFFVGFTTVCCSSDENDDVNNTEVVGNLVGTWKYTFSTGYQLVTFSSNGKGTLKEIDYASENYEDAFTYSYNSDTQILKIYWEDESPSEWQIISVTSKKLVVIDEDGERMTLTKQ